MSTLELWVEKQNYLFFPISPAGNTFSKQEITSGKRLNPGCF